MKKITLALSCLGILSLASCKKERTCTCTDVSTGGTASVYTIKYDKISKKEAKDVCNKSSTSTTEGGTTETSSTDCKLN